MTLLDARTIMAVMAISCLIVSAGLFITHAGRFRRDGMRLWAAGFAFLFAAWALIGARSLIPDILSIVVANTFQAVSYALFYAAVREFQGKASRRSVLSLPALAAVVFFWAYIDNLAYRVIFSGALFGLQCALIAWALFSGAPIRLRRTHWLTGCAFLVASLLWGFRMLEAFVGPPENLPLMTSSVARCGSLMIGFGFFLLSSYGFLLMTRERADQENERLATLDSLTEIFNRRTFLDLAEKEIARSRRNGLPLALLMVDFDHFKKINDTYGHLTGDVILKAFTALTLTCLRRNDIFGRYGGEEFAILLPETDSRGALFFAERLRSQIAAAAMPAGGDAVNWTVSIGITSLSGADTTNLDGVLRVADEALYAAKNGGRDRIVQLATEMATN